MEIDLLRNRLRRTLLFLFHTLTRLELIGYRHLAEQGPFLIASNHLSRLDAPLTFATLPRDDTTALVAKKYQRFPFFRWVIDAANAIWIDRENPEPQALRSALNVLRNGGVLGIAPEGTRSRSGELMPAKSGVAFLASKAGVPIIPMGITGTENAFAQLLRLRRPLLRVELGPPFTLAPLRRAQREADLQANADEIMCRIAAILPEGYRGAYQDHPRLIELLGGKKGEEN